MPLGRASALVAACLAVSVSSCKDVAQVIDPRLRTYLGSASDTADVASARAFAVADFYGPGIYLAGQLSGSRGRRKSRVRTLHGRLAVYMVGGTVFPSNVSADSIWLVLGDRVWSDSLVENGRHDDPRYPSLLLRMSTSFEKWPRWPVGSEVDVIVRLKDSAGNSWLIAKRKLRIKGPRDVTYV